ncbi:glutathione S-transferase T3-like [Brassica napus]|uniref:glutathione S-transferase T3-like n=1 Tax=Brassica napus TaxID=3708 RepID=UPI0006AA9F5E|nr:glutathione S-transferase T3-like [Brassica napus]
MDFNSYTSGSNFVDLLQSQRVFGSSEVPIFGTQQTVDSNLGPESVVERRERRRWTPSNDILLISSWLNTSKDAVVGTEQRSCAFWSRIASYFAASQKVAGEKTSGQNETDVLKKAHEIFYNNYKKKFTLEYAWMELCNDQKWCDVSSSRHGGSSKKRNLDDGYNSSASHATESKASAADDCTNRPSGVKASKARSKKTVDRKAADFQSMWSIKQQDLLAKKELYKMSLLDNLLAKREPLSESEEALKTKLIEDVLSV